MYITHPIIIIKSEESTFPIFVIFSLGCVSEGVVLSYAISFICISGKLGFVSLITVQFYNVRKWSNTLWPGGRIRLFALYTTSLSQLCRRIWRYWTSKILVSYTLSSVFTSKSVSQLSVMQYMGLCIQLTDFYDDCEDICVLMCILLSSSIRKCDPFLCLGLGHKRVLCAVCLSTSNSFRFQIQYVLFMKVQSGMYHQPPRANIHKLTHLRYHPNNA